MLFFRVVECQRVLFSPHPLQNLMFIDFFFFLMMAILTSVMWLIPHCGFYLYFFIMSIVSIFSCARWPSVCLPWRTGCLGFPLIFWVLFFFFFFCILSYTSCLYISEINPLSVPSFANISFDSEGCICHVLLYCAKVLSLIRSHLLIFVFIFIILAGGSKRILMLFMLNSVCQCFLPRILYLVFNTFWVYFCVHY